MQRRRFLSRTASALGLGPLSQFIGVREAEAQTWQKLSTGGGSSTPQIYAWGLGGCGVLGNNSTSPVSTPVTVCGISTAVAVAAGSCHSMALLSNGCVMSWGCNSIGQLGDNTTTAKSQPVTVCGISTAVAVAAGNCHSIVLLSNGCIRSWGYNNCGQLGDNTVTARSQPVSVCNISTAIAIAAGSNGSMALLSNGTIRAWGQNNIGQVGDNTIAVKTSPVAVCVISTAVAISAGAGSLHRLAVLANGTIMAWGSSVFGELGYNSTTLRCQPTAVCTITNGIGVAAGTNFSIALLASGCLMSWGRDFCGTLGHNTCGTDTSVPVAVCTITNAVAIAGGSTHSLAVLSSGSLMAWGAGGFGALGNGTGSDAIMPVAVCSIANSFASVARVKSNRNRLPVVATGANHSLYLHLG